MESMCAIPAPYRTLRSDHRHARAGASDATHPTPARVGAIEAPPTDGTQVALPGGAAALSPDAIGEHRRFMVGLARHLGRGRVDPEDLAQDVLERWLRAAHTSGSTSARDNPQAWMALVLRRLLIDRLRRRQLTGVVLARYRDSAPEAATAAATAAAPGIATDVAPWWAELDRQTIERELASLPPVLRQTFRLFTFEARSYKQIAQDLKIARATVGTRISRARALLRARLTDRAAHGDGACESSPG